MERNDESRRGGRSLNYAKVGEGESDSKDGDGDWEVGFVACGILGEIILVVGIPSHWKVPWFGLLQCKGTVFGPLVLAPTCVGELVGRRYHCEGLLISALGGVVSSLWWSGDPLLAYSPLEVMLLGALGLQGFSILGGYWCIPRFLLVVDAFVVMFLFLLGCLSPNIFLSCFCCIDQFLTFWECSFLVWLCAFLVPFTVGVVDYYGLSLLSLSLGFPSFL